MSKTATPATPPPKGKNPTVKKTNSTRRAGIALAVILTAWSYPWVRDYATDIGVFLGEVPSINMEYCQAVPGMQACEDIHIHQGSGLAFTACGSVEARKMFFPPMAKLDITSTGKGLHQDTLKIYDIERNTHTTPVLQGFPADADRNFHGMGVHDRSEKELTLFLVNHRRTGSVIEVFDYTVGDTKFVHQETIKHPMIQTPNDIVPMGPRSFYVTNDHKYIKGLMRVLEDFLRLPVSNIIYYSPEKTIEAAKDIITANGIAANPSRSEIYVSACHGGGLHILKPNADNTLTETDYIKLDFFNDNISYDEKTSSLLIAGHVQPLKIKDAMESPGATPVTPSKVIQVSRRNSSDKEFKKNPFEIKTILQDNGAKLATATTAVLDRQRNVMLVGTFLGVEGFMRCEIPPGV